MIHELRIYDCCPGRLPALMRLIGEHAVPAWQRTGVRLVGAWTPLIGERSQRLCYLLAWENLAEREKWDTFLADREWIAARDEAQRDGPIVANVHNQLLVPTTYSGLGSMPGVALPGAIA